MALTSGSQLGPYEILALVGEGGMGEVYKARDTRLDRTVALKVSKADFTERFEREARAVAALNHPSICTLHDVGPNYLVFEYVEGQPIRGPLPVEKALDYAAQICTALDAAHSKKITHRDLKPDNILVTKQGVKLLDFGLAKIDKPVEIADQTVTNALTAKGQILGTLLYMSPEQLQGKEADARSDIFSFGCVLYELLTGKRAFDGGSPASVIAAILERPAPSVTDACPRALDQVLKRCFEKDPENRWQNARDLRAALDLIAPVGADPPMAPASRGRTWLWGAAAALGLIATLLAGMHFGKAKPEASRQPVRFQVPVAPAGGLRPMGAISPDGLSLAYFDAMPNGSTAIRLRSVSLGTTTDFPSTEMAQPTHLFWSPDSKAIYFGSRRFLKRLDVSRNTVQQICDCPSDSGTVNQEGVVLLGGTPAERELRRISASGQGTTLRKATDPYSLPGSPYFLPDGRRYLFGEGNTIFLASLDEPQTDPRRLSDLPGRFALVAGLNGSYLLLMQANGESEALPFDTEKGEIAGPPLRLRLGASEPVGNSSASNNGILLRLTSIESSQVVVWFNREGKRLANAGAVEGYAGMDLSPDGGRLALISPNGLEIRDLARGTVAKLAQQVKPEGAAIWSPDGTTLVFAARGKDRAQRLYRADANHAQAESVLWDEPSLHWPNDWSRDGKYLLYGFDEGKTFRDLWALPMDQPGAKPFQYTHGTSLIKQGRFSPNGHFVYTSDESGRYEIYLQPFPDASKGKWVISRSGGVEPAWSPDGRELFFFSGQTLMLVDVRDNHAVFGRRRGVPGRSNELGRALAMTLRNYCAHRRLRPPEASELRAGCAPAICLGAPLPSWSPR
jgi:Tol biopolymer transport system component